MRKAIALTLTLFGAAMTASADGYTKNVAIVIFNGVELLDLAGAGEVFAAASHAGANGEQRPFNVYTVASTKSPVVSQGFLNVTPNYSIADAPRPDILVLAGGQARTAIADAPLMTWVKSSGDRAENVLTICYGAFIAGHAGLLDGLDITTWYGSVGQLGTEFPKSRALPGRRFIDNGKVITTAGVAAGIDGSLHLVARTLGRYVADRTAEYMQYAWAPESYTSTTYPQFNPRLDAHGRQMQIASIAAHGGDVDEAAALYRGILSSHPDDNAAWLALGRLMFSAKRYPDAIDSYRHAASGAQRGAALYDLACAYALSGQPDKAIATVSDAIDAGFRAKASYQNDPDLASIRDDARFKELLTKL